MDPANLDYLLRHKYPEDIGISECAVEDQMEKLINFVQDTQESNNNIALDKLAHSQKLMKHQYDKKLTRARASLWNLKRR